MEDGGHQGEEDDGDCEEEARQEEGHVEAHRVLGAPAFTGVDRGRYEGGDECDEEQTLKGMKLLRWQNSPRILEILLKVQVTIPMQLA